MKARLPANEKQRIDALHRYAILDTVAQREYDDIVLLASQICRTPIAAISLVDTDRQWFKSVHGLEVRETPRDIAFCAHAILDRDVLIVPDARTDPRFRDNPLVVHEPQIRFYAGAPLITASGESLGTLCVIDREPRHLSQAELESLRALSRQVMVNLELRRVSHELEASLQIRESYARELEAHQHTLEHRNMLLEIQCLSDPLTGINNRRAFEHRINSEVERSGRYQVPLSLLLIDIDHFKAFNDRFGHPAGDEVLVMVARALQSSLRRCDSAFRIGGEEFAIVLSHTEPEGALILAERVRMAVEQVAWQARSITVSVGVATYSQGDAAELIAEADAALYAAKAQGRNRVMPASSTSRAA